MDLLAGGLGVGGRYWRLVGVCALMLIVVLVAGAARAAADVVVDSNLSDPIGVAVDGSGDVFISDSTRVVEDKPNGSHGYTQTLVDNSVSPGGVAVDGSGDLFIADTSNNRVVEDMPGSFTHTLVDTSVSSPLAVAVDGSGDVFTADTGNNRVVEDTPNGSGGFTQSVVDTNVSVPTAVAVDGSGDVFTADTLHNRVVEDKPNGSGGFTQSVVDTSLSFPDGVAVDGSGDVFISDSNNGRVVEDKPNGSGGFTQSVVDTGLNSPDDITLDSSDDLFIDDSGNNRVVVHPAPPRVVRAASLAGTATDGQSLHLSFEFSSVVGPLAHVYQWRRCTDQAMTQNCQTVGTNSRSYKLSSADVGRYITAMVTATDTQSQSTSSTSPADGPVAAPSAPAVVVESVLTGPMQDGQDLRVGRFQFSSPDTLVYHYRWERCSDFAMTQNCLSVGDGHRFYLLSSADVRRFITATVTATDQEGQSTSSTSQVVGPIASPDPPSVLTAPTITGTAQQGHSLVAGAFEFSSPDPLSYHFQWRRCSDQAMTQNCGMVGTDSKYYKLSASDAGDFITATVTASDQESQSTSATSQPVGPIS